MHKLILMLALMVPVAARAEPPAYIVGSITVTDPDAYARDYARHVPPLVAAHGGRYLVRGGAVEPLEGATPRPRHVIVVFPSMARARAYWNSPEYRALAKVRQRTSTGDLLLVEGLSD